jgi:ubiquitin C-terminal hydrolase
VPVNSRVVNTQLDENLRGLRDWLLHFVQMAGVDYLVGSLHHTEPPSRTFRAELCSLRMAILAKLINSLFCLDPLFLSDGESILGKYIESGQQHFAPLRQSMTGVIMSSHDHRLLALSLMNLMFELSSEACKIDVGEECNAFLLQSRATIHAQSGTESGGGGGAGSEPAPEHPEGGAAGQPAAGVNGSNTMSSHSLPLSVSQSMNVPHLSSAVKFGLRLLRGTLFSSVEARKEVSEYQLLDRWVKLMLLQVPDQRTRQETAKGILDLCSTLKTTKDGSLHVSFATSMLVHLKYACGRKEGDSPRKMRRRKQLAARNSREYFCLLTALLKMCLDDVDGDGSGTTASALMLVDFDALCTLVLGLLMEHDSVERIGRSSSSGEDGEQADQVMIGLLKVQMVLLHKSVDRKIKAERTGLVGFLFLECLFDSDSVTLDNNDDTTPQTDPGANLFDDSDDDGGDNGDDGGAADSKLLSPSGIIGSISRSFSLAGKDDVAGSGALQSESDVLTKARAQTETAAMLQTPKKRTDMFLSEDALAPVGESHDPAAAEDDDDNGTSVFGSTCKSKESRAAAFACLGELCLSHSAPVASSTTKLLTLIHGLHQRHRNTHIKDEWSYNPDDLLKGSGQFVGLRNQGATCYMNSLLQQLYHVPAFRREIFALDIEEGKDAATGTECSPLYQLQVLFGFLQMSQQKFYDTMPFCKNFTIEGAPMRLDEQKDVNEFCQVLFDRIENSHSDGKTAVDKIFAGKLSNQIISTESEHKSEREEMFTMVTLEIKDQKNIIDSLELFVQGEQLTGENKWVPTDDKELKVDATKRTLFKELPQVLILHLKRFEFDYQTMTKHKLNDEYEFPLQLDMNPYTMQGMGAEVDGGENSDGPPAKSKGLYHLKGIVAHLGTTDTGHYYSFIRADDGAVNENGEGGTWLEFNDKNVRPFSEDRIPEECFGGEYTTRIFNQNSQSYVDHKRVRNNNAYLLVYTTVGASGDDAPATDRQSMDEWGLHGAGALHLQPTSPSPCKPLANPGPGSSAGKLRRQRSSGSTSAALSPIMNRDRRRSSVGGVGASFAHPDDQMPPLISQAVWEKSQDFLTDLAVFDQQYFEFMWKLMHVNTSFDTAASTNSNTTISSDGGVLVKPSSMVLQISCHFILDLLVRGYRSKASLPLWLSKLTALFVGDIASCLWFLRTLANTASCDWLSQLLVACPDRSTRKHFSKLLLFCINEVRNEYNSNDGWQYSDSLSEFNSVDSVKDEQMQTVKIIIVKLFGRLSDSSNAAGGRNTVVDHADQLAEFFELMHGVVSIGPEERRFIVESPDVRGVQLLTNFYTTDLVSYRMKGDRVVSQPKSPDLRVLGDILLFLVSMCEDTVPSGGVSTPTTQKDTQASVSNSAKVAAPAPAAESESELVAQAPPVERVRDAGLSTLKTDDLDGSGSTDAKVAVVSGKNPTRTVIKCVLDKEAHTCLWNHRFLLKFCRQHPHLALELLERICKDNDTMGLQFFSILTEKMLVRPERATCIS